MRPDLRQPSIPTHDDLVLEVLAEYAVGTTIDASAALVSRIQARIDGEPQSPPHRFLAALVRLRVREMVGSLRQTAVVAAGHSRVTGAVRGQAMLLLIVVSLAVTATGLAAAAGMASWILPQPRHAPMLPVEPVLGSPSPAPATPDPTMRPSPSPSRVEPRATAEPDPTRTPRPARTARPGATHRAEVAPRPETPRRPRPRPDPTRSPRPTDRPRVARTPEPTERPHPTERAEATDSHHEGPDESEPPGGGGSDDGRGRDGPDGGHDGGGPGDEPGS
jgi:hypothetical protein